MIEIGRPSRLKGAGFYEYDDGRQAPGPLGGLAETFPPSPRADLIEDVKDRMLFVEALETAKCFEEGVIESAAAANIGSIMGIGFPPCTGGAAQFMTGYEGRRTGRRSALRRPWPGPTSRRAYGDRFRPTDRPRGDGREGRVPSPPDTPRWYRGVVTDRRSLPTGPAKQRPASGSIRRRRESSGRPPPALSSTSAASTCGSARWRPSAASTSRRTPGRPPRCSAATAPASPRPCASSPGWSRPPPGTGPGRGVDVRTDPLTSSARSATAPTSAGWCPRATPWEHLQLAARLRRLDDWEERARDLLERFEPRRRRPPGDRRVLPRHGPAAVGGARRLPRAEVLLLDEPFDGVDPIGVEATLDVIADARARGAACWSPPTCASSRSRPAARAGPARRLPGGDRGRRRDGRGGGRRAYRGFLD